MSWLSRKAHTFASAARNGGKRAEKIAAQGIAHARKAGVMTARKVLSVQRAAKLNDKLMHRSALSVVGKPEPQLRPGDVAWTDGYRAVVVNEIPEALDVRTSFLRPAAGRPQIDREAAS